MDDMLPFAEVPKRPRLFILKDSHPLSLDVANAAEGFGCEIVGPIHRLSPEATEIAKCGDVDVAIIDLVLVNGTSDSIIRQLQKRGVPVIICSGLMKNAVKHEYPDAEVLGKPTSRMDLHLALSSVLLTMRAAASSALTELDSIPPFSEAGE